ncbi:hypothetical protein QFK56_02045 [Weissella cibaria]|uniref:hypothetical protein n=1 Tax=Weissella cibaria TaxID=137591 RepID=UPI0024557702|nr:hypothetical protein [Weissella cibaria]MDH5011940.1 hypothetical protein [Weissella cibaria]
MKTILLLLIGFVGAFVVVTHTDDVLAPDKPTIQNVLPVNRTERALVLDARKKGLDYALSIVENRTGRVTDDKYWLLKDPHGGGYWGDYNSDPTNDGVKQYKTVAGKEVLEVIKIYEAPDATTLEKAKQVLALYCQ